jgi:ketosteroid isomerase-like protein
VTQPDDGRGAVAAAADRLVAAFSAHDVGAYFAAFSPDATFLFHTSPDLLGSRAEYETEWAAWEADGFRVLGCTTRDRRVDVVAPGVAVMTHRVRTRLAGVDDVQKERESIVFAQGDDGEWLAVHEHLSADPDDAL